MKKLALKSLETHQLSTAEKRQVLGGKMKCWDIMKPGDKRCPGQMECINGICQLPIEIV